MPANTIAPGFHLYWSELACHDPMMTCYPMDYRATTLMQKLAPAHEGLRDRLKHPSTILSAYRTPEWNAKVGGEAESFHIKGAALDLLFEGIPTLEVARAAVEEAVKGKLIRGVGYYPDHGIVHIDVGPRPRLTLWKCVMTLTHLTPIRKYVPWDGESA